MSHTEYNIPLLVEGPIKESALTAISSAANRPIHFQDLQPFIVTSVTVSTTQYMEIATISGISDKLGKFVIVITGMSMQDKDDHDIVANHTVTVLSGFKCNVSLRFLTDIFCGAVSSALTSSPLETFSLVVDKSFPVHLLDCIDDPLQLIEDFVDRYIERVKPDFDDLLGIISDPPACNLDDQLSILKIRACMEHDCKDECTTQCICESCEDELYISEILDIGSKFIKPITSLIRIHAQRIEGPEEPLEKDGNKFANLLKPKEATDGDVL
jgi:hypothetical protein